MKQKASILNITILCLFTILSAFGQDNEFNPFAEVVPVSPTAASLAKYGDIPVGLHTGTPEINIPLYTQQGKNLSVPISLSYHASGMRVEEMASWVGFGWSLNAGGVITRTIRGNPDDDANGYIYCQALPPLSANESELCTYFHQDVEGGQADSEPDIFYFNVNGYAGEFFFDQNGIAYTVPYQNILIDRLDAAGNEIGPQQLIATKGFKLTTPDGNQYIFGLTGANGEDNWDTSTNTSRCSSASQSESKTSVTAWQLSKIVHPNRGEIRFNYSKYLTTFEGNVSETRYMLKAPLSGCIGESPNYCYNQSIINVALLQSIETVYDNVDYGKVEFEHETGRQDLDGGVRLKKMNIIGANGQLLKYFEFTHDYFFSGAANPEFDDYRLRLKHVQEFSSSAEAIPPFTFDYIGNTFFPHRKTKAQDHWGYYNAVTDNTTLIPPHTYGTQTVGSADREPDPVPMQKGTLQKITYPTGGYTFFKYEPHSIPVNITTEIVDQEAISTAECINTPVTDQTNFTILNGTTDVLFTPSFNTGSNPIVFDYHAKVFDSSNPGNALLNFSINNTAPVVLPLPPGDYYLETYAAEPGTSSTITAQWQEEIPLSEPIYEQIVGGLRIKRITDHDGLDPAKDNTRFFDYNATVDGITSSSGLLNRVVNYEGIKKIAIASLSCQIQSICEYRSFSSVSNMPLMYKSGSVVGYEQVKVIQPGIGSTQNKFTVATDIGVGSYPHPPFISNNWKKGLVLEQTDFDESGTEVRKVTNEYTLDDSGTYGTARGISYGWEWVLKDVCEQNGVPCRKLATEFYTRFSPVVFLDKTITSIDGVQIVKDFVYDPDHLNPLTETFTNSDGKQHVIERQYAKEAGATCLLDRHMDNTLVKQVHKVNGTVVRGIETVFNQIYGQCLPESIYEILENDVPLLRTTFTFHSDGNIQSYIRRGFAPETYIWDRDLLISRSFLNFNWEYKYYGKNRQIKEITDIKGLKSTFQYDNFQRLSFSNSRNGGLFATYKYYHTLIGGGDPNRVEIFTSEDNVTRKNYVDGLGRTLQTLSLQYGPGMEDVVHGAVEYDKFARVLRQFQPHPGSGSYNPPGGPHDHFTYEASPLSRELIRTFADGTNMQTVYAANTSSDEVVNYQTGGNYPDNELYKVTVYDEKGHPTITFRDKIDRVILVRKKWDGNNVDTYYQYDDRDNLLAVMPPGCTSTSDTYIGYQYSYDERNRMETKKLPGAGVQQYTYNDRDEVITASDGNGNLVEYEYDGHGRDVLTKLQKPNAQQAVPIIDKEYDGPGGGYMGELVRESKSILSGNLARNIVTSYNYDQFGRVERMSDGAYRGGSDNFRYQYEGATDRVSQVNRNYGRYAWYEKYLYDHIGREKVQIHRMTGGFLHESIPYFSARYSSYDIKDQLVIKGLNGLQTIGYGYDVRGRLLRINKLPLVSDPKYSPDFICDGSGGAPPPAATQCGGQIVDLETLLDLIVTENELSVDCYDPGCVEEGGPVEICDYTTSTNGLTHLATINDAGGAPVISFVPPLDLSSAGAAAAIETEIINFLDTYGYEYGSVNANISSGFLSISITETDFEFLSLTDDQERTFYFVDDCTIDPSFPTGTPTQTSNQSNSLQNLSTDMANMTVSDVQFPTTIYSVNLYDGRSGLVFEQEMDVIDGEAIPVKCMDVEDSTEIVTIVQDGIVVQKTMSQFLSIRQDNFNGSTDLPNDMICDEGTPLCIYNQQYEPKGIVSTCVISNDLNLTCNDILASTTGTERTLEIDGDNWTDGANGEIGWNISLYTGSSDPVVQALTVKIVAGSYSSYPGAQFAIHNGQGFLTVNGGATYSGFDSNGLLIMNLDNPGTLEAIDLINLKLALYKQGLVSIDGIEVDIVYQAPCEPCSVNAPPCTPQERLLQESSMNALQNSIQTMQVSQVTFPTILYRLRFCDQTEIYVLESELSLISGSYAVMQEIGIESVDQFMEVYSVNGLEETDFAGFLDFRRNDPDLLVEGGGCSVEIDFTEGPLCTYKLEQENWSYENIANSSQVKVLYEDVIKKNCENTGYVEISRTPNEVIVDVEKTYVATTNGIVEGSGYIDHLKLKTKNPDQLISVNLNKNTFLGTYPELLGEVDPNSMSFNTPEAYEQALERIIHHRIGLWQEEHGLSSISYELIVDISVSTGGPNLLGYISIGFQIYHQPTDPYVCFSGDLSTFLRYSTNGSLIEKAYGIVIPGSEVITTHSNDVPCGLVSVTYSDAIINTTAIEWDKLPLNEPSPTWSFDSPCSFGVTSNYTSVCDKPMRVWDGEEFTDCEYCEPYVPETPECSVTEAAEQRAYIDNLMEQYSNMDPESLSFPDDLHQVMLCDGTLTYIFGQHLDGLPGGTTIVQSIPVGGSGQTFEVPLPADTTDLFAMRLYYEPNGNVKKVRWQVKYEPEQQYDFVYDDLDRMEEANYSGQDWLSSARYYEHVTYKDGRGNIKTLVRGGSIGGCDHGIIDDLVYTYDNNNKGNKVVEIFDSADPDRGFIYRPGGPINEEYRYDGNANMIYDWHKGIDDITYNYLNLPESISFGGASLEYIYDALGKKHRSPGPFDFVNNVHFSPDGFEAVYHDEGRVTPIYNDILGTLDSMQYEYVIRDHLNNGRVYFSDLDKNYGISSRTPQEVLQDRHYYPFGMQYEGAFYPQVGPTNEYTYNDKRYHREGDLNWYDHGFRWYDPTIARWWGQDPLSDLDHNLPLTPYHFVADNPVTNIDPDGLDWYRNNESGEVHWREGSEALDGHRNIGAEYVLEGKNDFIVHHQNEVVKTISKETLDGVSESSTMAYALGLSGVLLADDATGIGVADDVAIPVILAAAATYDITQRIYVTYNLTNPTTGQIYSGRTSGYGDPHAVMLGRYIFHHKRLQGFELPTLDKAVQGLQAYPAIRGREQQLIDLNGGAWSEGGSSGNAIRGVSKANPLGQPYHGLSNLYFGPLFPYTGF